jgi:hypothetical protein
MRELGTGLSYKGQLCNDTIMLVKITKFQVKSAIKRNSFAYRLSENFENFGALK